MASVFNGSDERHSGALGRPGDHLRGPFRRAEHDHHHVNDLDDDHVNDLDHLHNRP